MTERPRFHELTRTECTALLERHHVGRIAFTFNGYVDIEPISYVYSDGWLYGRTSPGTKLLVLTRHPWVAFQVDEVVDPLDWKSVVLHGTAYFLDPDIAGDTAYERAVELIRGLDPRALTDEDLVPERTVLFRIHVDEMVGRAASRPE